MPANSASTSMPCGATALMKSTTPSVSDAPGQMALTRMPHGANSMASARVRPMRACLEVM